MKAASLLLLALCLFSSHARSQSPFDGAWIIDPGKTKTSRPKNRGCFLSRMECFAMAIGNSRPMVLIRRFLPRGIGIQSAFAS